MIFAEWTHHDAAGVGIHVYCWQPDLPVNPWAVVQIVHGVAETAVRYERFAAALTESGLMVYANDHRGHGRTAESIDKLGQVGEDAFSWMVQDLGELTADIRSRHPNLPILLFAHSMGSFLAQLYISEPGEKLDGVILSGTHGKFGWRSRIGSLIATREIHRLGPLTRSPLLAHLMFGSYNRRVARARTSMDWLTRDVEEVDRYLADPMCGFTLSAGFYSGFFRGLSEMHNRTRLKRIPRDLPILILAGMEDPVGRYGRGVRSLLHTYRRMGLTNVSCHWYPGARHELLNDTSRDVVTQDILVWIRYVVGSQGVSTP